MRQDKNKAIELRRQGKTYREIQKELVISRSTLCEWFRNEAWSTHIKKSNIQRNIRISTERIKILTESRRIILDKKYRDVEIEAHKEFEIYKNNPLFIAGLMLYAGEGDKRDKGTIRFANTDFNLHKVFINFSEKYLKKERNAMKVAILLYPDLDISTCVKKWSQELTIEEKNFYKPQVIQGKLKTRKLHFGVGTTIILSSFLKRKLMLWIEKANIYLL